MRLHLGKKGLRVLGVAESFVREKSDRAALAGVVMRTDGVIDGFSLGSCRVGGMDSTENIIRMFRDLGREDINALMLNGCVISWFNVVDLNVLHESIGLPTTCVTYDVSEGLKKYFEEYFPHDWERRYSVYQRNGARTRVKLRTGYPIFLRCFGMEVEEGLGLVNRFTVHGKIPEPIRLSKSLAHCFFRTFSTARWESHCLQNNKDGAQDA